MVRRSHPRSFTRTIPVSGWWPVATRGCLAASPTRANPRAESDGSRPRCHPQERRWRNPPRPRRDRRPGRPGHQPVPDEEAHELRGSFAFSRNAENIAREAALDGIYVIRTSLPEQDMAADDCVRSYKALARGARISNHEDGQPARSSDLPSHRNGCAPTSSCARSRTMSNGHKGSLAGSVVLRSGTRGDLPHP